jgi:hypothetical protein
MVTEIKGRKWNWDIHSLDKGKESMNTTLQSCLKQNFSQGTLYAD